MKNGQQFFLIKKLFIFDCTGSLLLCGLFSSSGEWGLLSRCGALASHCGSFSCCRAQVLGQHTLQQWQHMGSVVVAPRLQITGSIVVVHRFSVSMARGIFPDQELNSCLLHWQADSLPLSHQESSIVVGTFKTYIQVYFYIIFKSPFTN